MIIKWIFDRVVSFIGLLFLWPILIVVAIMIKVKMPGGPVLFVQQRVGKGGKLFSCHKFRSMLVAPTRNENTSTGSAQAENENKSGWSSVSVAGDSRITPFGATLRHYKLDELPGLWDVLIGNMSFVGPRPDVPGYADKLEGDDRDVLKLRPGITGPATLKYRLEDEMLETFVAEVRSGKAAGGLDKNQKNPSADGETTSLLSDSACLSESELSTANQNQTAAICNGSPSTEAKNQRFAKNLSLKMPENLPVNINEMSDQELAVWYNDNVIYPDKVRLNCYYYRHYSFMKDIQMIFATVLGFKVKFAGEEV